MTIKAFWTKQNEAKTLTVRVRLRRLVGSFPFLHGAKAWLPVPRCIILKLHRVSASFFGDDEWDFPRVGSYELDFCKTNTKTVCNFFVFVLHTVLVIFSLFGNFFEVILVMNHDVVQLKLPPPWPKWLWVVVVNVVKWQKYSLWFGGYYHIISFFSFLYKKIKIKKKIWKKIESYDGYVW